MRGIWRLLAAAALFLAILAFSAYLFRGPIAGAGLRWALASAGFQRPSLTVKEITFSRLAVADVIAGSEFAPAFWAKYIDVTFDIFHLLSERRVTSISLGPGSVNIAIDNHGAMSIAGAPLALERRETTGALPFDRIRIDQLTLSVDAPEGSARGHIDGEFSMDDGGAFTAIGEAALLSVGAWRMKNAAFEGTLTLARNDTFVAETRLAGDFAAPAGEANGARLAINAEGEAWRDVLAGRSAGPKGSAQIDFHIAQIPTASNPWLAPLRRTSAPAAPPIETLSVDGGFGVSFAEGRLATDHVDGAPLRITSERGDAFVLSGLDGAPIYERDGARARLGFVAALSGSALTGSARLNARSQGEDGWTYEASSALAAHAIGAVRLGKTSLSSAGVVRDGVVEGKFLLATHVQNALMGVLRLSNAPIEADMRLKIDLASKSLTAFLEEGRCVLFERVDFMIDGQDSDGRLAGAKLCGDDGPVFSTSWSDPPQAILSGELTAREGRYRIARTRFRGAPPSISFNAAYDGALDATTANGLLSGGRILINNALTAAAAEGIFSGRFDSSGLAAEAQLASIRLSQNASPVQVAPVRATGMARLERDRIAFNYTASTPSGLPLGVGEGTHDVRAGRGQTVFRTGDIQFAVGGVQPANVVPALKGVIGAADGAGEGEFAFAWGPKPSDFASSGVISLTDVSFQGPGRAITKTGGVTGTLRLASLSPLETDGPQALSIRLIDLDALQLENGAAHFELPGDDTLRIIDAEFPWFGGKIGAYDTVAAITGETAITALRASDVDLTKVLDFVDIEGLSGEGLLSGVFPLVFREGKTHIVDGVLTSNGPGAIRYVGKAADAAAAAGEDAQIAFSILRDLRFTSLKVTINGPLDGSIDFKCEFKGSGDVPRGSTIARLPVLYSINIEAKFLELLRQANLTRDFRLQVLRAHQKPQE